GPPCADDGSRPQSADQGGVVGARRADRQPLHAERSRLHRLDQRAAARSEEGESAASRSRLSERHYLLVQATTGWLRLRLGRSAAIDVRRDRRHYEYFADRIPGKMDFRSVQGW